MKAVQYFGLNCLVALFFVCYMTRGRYAACLLRPIYITHVYIHMVQRLNHLTTDRLVVGSILADATAFTDFVPFSKVLKPNCLFPTHGCAEAFILQWIDTAWNLFLFYH